MLLYIIGSILLILRIPADDVDTFLTSTQGDMHSSSGAPRIVSSLTGDSYHVNTLLMLWKRYTVHQSTQEVKHTNSSEPSASHRVLD